ncbi:MAG: TetR/AcrR family transcriptional regulator [Caulobacter sp.]|jgi:AcrR family transcriptional regulator
MRRSPTQQRGKAKVDFILEAAARLLEDEGEAGFNTNAIAERAGVSIGALYRYFPDKQAILLALADREVAAHQAQMRALMAQRPEGLALDRAMIRAFLRAFGERTRARRIAMRAWFAQPAEARGAEGFVVETPMGAGAAPLSPLRQYVLSRALLGVMRSAVLEGRDFLLDPAFEDELVRLARAYVKAD